ncbi:hypothetical protein K435DRAFT_779240 [Dendrothele bispora CBS 962.96]|uniref:Uncharacterized protein n=1 Tax=Dendrothele bispora (strain CBS 962.96) TaxID=1314807 RepID=A0A4S8M029_DENBC|nr:hypothetical protein K435DRAFT_779240 [Dendrothele bispora CBS 962.96]
MNQLTPTDQAILGELRTLPPDLLDQVKREVNVDTGKDLDELTPEERNRLIGVHRRRTSQLGMGMPNNFMGQPSMGVPQHPMNNMGGPMSGQGNVMGTLQTRMQSMGLQNPTGQQNQGSTPNPSRSMEPSPTSILGNAPAPPGPSLHQPVQQSQGPNLVNGIVPTSILGSQSMSMGPPSPSNADLFTSEFLNNVAGALDEFDTNLFRPEGDINFERDFGQWFNREDAGSGLD